MTGDRDSKSILEVFANNILQVRWQFSIWAVAEWWWNIGNTTSAEVPRASVNILITCHLLKINRVLKQSMGDQKDDCGQITFWIVGTEWKNDGFLHFCCIDCGRDRGWIKMSSWHWIAGCCQQPGRDVPLGMIGSGGALSAKTGGLWSTYLGSRSD